MHVYKHYIYDTKILYSIYKPSMHILPNSMLYYVLYNISSINEVIGPDQGSSLSNIKCREF